MVLILALIMSASLAGAQSVKSNTQNGKCQPHQCTWEDSPGANCGVKEISSPYRTIWVSSSECKGGVIKGKKITVIETTKNGKMLVKTVTLPDIKCVPGGLGTWVTVYKVEKVKCCGNIHVCCDYSYCKNTNECAPIPITCKENPGPQTACTSLGITYK